MHGLCMAFFDRSAHGVGSNKHGNLNTTTLFLSTL
jgi:hypothetical protein